MKQSTEQNILADIDLSAGLTQQQAEQIYQQGREAVVFALLKQSQMLAEKRNLQAAVADDPSTPSAQKPAFTKKNKSGGKRNKRPGRNKGHKGSRRPKPRVDRTVEHRPVPPDLRRSGSDELFKKPFSPDRRSGPYRPRKIAFYGKMATITRKFA